MTCNNCGRGIGTSLAPRHAADDRCYAESSGYDHDKLDCERIAHARTKAEAGAREGVLVGALREVAALIDESHGVAGLHLNGDVAPWSELREGGRFEWLGEFDRALANPSPAASALLADAHEAIHWRALADTIAPDHAAVNCAPWVTVRNVVEGLRERVGIYDGHFVNALDMPPETPDPIAWLAEEYAKQPPIAPRRICAYCGWIGPDGGGPCPEMQAHMETCEAHPMRAMLARAAWATRYMIAGEDGGYTAVIATSVRGDGWVVEVPDGYLCRDGIARGVVAGPSPIDTEPPIHLFPTADLAFSALAKATVSK